MPQDRSKGGFGSADLEAFRAQQEEMLNLSREYSRARVAAWVEETRSLSDTWDAFSQEWEGSLDGMAALAGTRFEEIAAQGEATGSLLSQSMKKALADTSGEVEDWADHFLNSLERVALAWTGTFGSGGSGGAAGGDWSSLLGAALGFGGWFHQGGVVQAHQGLVVSPETLMGDEQLVLAQTGEGILPRESMARLGEQSFEALRTGRFAVASGGASRFDITIQVQSLDAEGVAGLNWDRLVQRHLLPALKKEVDRRW
jgi:hypothetical protein